MTSNEAKHFVLLEQNIVRCVISRLCRVTRRRFEVASFQPPAYYISIPSLVEYIRLYSTCIIIGQCVVIVSGQLGILGKKWNRLIVEDFRLHPSVFEVITLCNR